MWDCIFLHVFSHYKWQTRRLFKFPNAYLKVLHFCQPAWPANETSLTMFLSKHLFLSIYFKMQLSGFESEKECSYVLSLSSNIHHQAAEEMWLSSPQPTRWFFSSTIQAQWAMQACWIPHQLNLLHNFSETMILSENKCNSLELIFPQCLTFSFL